MRKRQGLGVGDCVAVRPRVVDPDFNTDIGGWQGRISTIGKKFVSIVWDSVTLKGIPKSMLNRCEQEGLDWTQMDLVIADIQPAEPRDTEADVQVAVSQLAQEVDRDDLGEEAEKTGEALADPTIAQVLEEFLAEQRARLKPGTLRKYEDVVHLFQSCMNNYAYQTLDAKEGKLFDRLYNAEGPAHREFCQIFGPDKIPGNVGEFLGYFMIRKVMCGKDLKQAAGTVMKKLGRWLGQKSYIDPEAAADMAESGGEASKDLPAAEDLAKRLAEYAESTATACDDENVIEDHFDIDRIEPGRLYLLPSGGGSKLSVPVPKDLAAACREGWSLSGAVGKTSKGWRLLEVWNVYP